MRSRIDECVAELARTQLGLLEHDQLAAAGVSDDAIGHRLATGRWERVHPAVYRLAGTPGWWEQALVAACLAAGTGSVASHRAAAALWRLDGVRPGEVEITVPRTVGPRLKGVRVHRSTDLAPDDVVSNDAGVRVTAPARTLVDLGAVVPEWTVGRALDHALSRKLVTIESVRDALARLGGRGRRGAGVLRRVLEERGVSVGSAPPAGVLEARFARLLRQHGLPTPRAEYEVYRGNHLLGRVDFAYPDVRLAIETDGYEWHASPTAFQHDRARQNDLVEAGWTVLRFTYDDVTRRPDYVAGRVRRLLVVLDTSTRS